MRDESQESSPRTNAHNYISIGTSRIILPLCECIIYVCNLKIERVTAVSKKHV